MVDYSIDENDMITPLQSGQTLVDDIRLTNVQPGEVAVWWLGQSGYAIKTASILFYVDLYLSEHLTAKYAATEKPHVRITHAPLRGADLPDVEWVFSSHKHSDHLDPGTLPDVFAHNPAVKLILPKAVVEHAESIGLESSRFIPTPGDETLSAGPMTVHAIPSAHHDLDYDPQLGYPYLGYVFVVDGVTLYHSGDTVIYEGLAQRLKKFDVDIAFLPVNGTDARRTGLKVPPNMSIEDALALAAEIGRPLLIPHHYDMFTFNTADIEAFKSAAEAANIPYRVLQCGEKFMYHKQI